MHKAKDIQGREVLDIIVSNNFYKLLQNNEVGMIAEGLWGGPPSVSIFQTGFNNSFLFEEVFDDKQSIMKQTDLRPKKYIFQFHMWKNSCEHRYIAEAFSILLLAVFY